MPCWKQKLSVGAASMCGAGSGFAIVVSAGVAAVPGILGTIGSLLWLISALKDLVDCLKKKGKEEEAARLQQRIDALEREVERLKRLVS